MKRILASALTACTIIALFSGCAIWDKLFNPEDTLPIGKEGSVLDWNDEFSGNELDTTKWLPQYLPHVTKVPLGAAADYEIGGGVLTLKISEDRVGLYGGKTGFKVCGMQTYNTNNLHENNATGVKVDPFNGYTTKYGYFEIRCKIPACDGGGHVAFWMIGTGVLGTKNVGEIDIIETKLNVPNYHMPKVFAWVDKNLHDWRGEYIVQGDVTSEWHTYAVDWRPEYLAFYVDGVEVLRTEQSPNYEMCMILSMYINDQYGSDYWAGPPSDVYPKEWEIDYVRVYKDINGYAE